LLANRFFGGFVISFRRLLNEAHTYGFGRDLNFADLAVDNSPNLLYIWLKLSLGNTGNFPADSTKMLCFTSPGDASAGYGSLAGKITYSRHPTRSCSLCLDFYGIIAVEPHEYITSYLKCKCKATFFAENTLFRRKTPLRHNFLNTTPQFDTPLKVANKTLYVTLSKVKREESHLEF
jgi:hypothetical protein